MPNYQKAWRIKDEFKDKEGHTFLREQDWAKARQGEALNVLYFQRTSKYQIFEPIGGNEQSYLEGSILEGPMETAPSSKPPDCAGSGRTTYQTITRLLPEPLPESTPVALLSTGTRWDYQRPPLEIYDGIGNVNKRLIHDIFQDLIGGVVESRGFADRTYFQKREGGEAATVVAGQWQGALLQIEYFQTHGFPCLRVQAFGYEDLAQEALYPRRLVERLREAIPSVEDQKLALEDTVRKGFDYGSAYSEVFDLSRIGERKDVII